MSTNEDKKRPSGQSTGPDPDPVPTGSGSTLPEISQLGMTSPNISRIGSSENASDRGRGGRTAVLIKPSTSQTTRQEEAVSVSKVWDEIFNDGREFGSSIHLEARPGPTQARLFPPQTPTQPPSRPDESATSRLNAHAEDYSMYSIIPGAITLSTDLRSQTSFRKRKSGKRCTALFASCCSSDTYTATHNKLAHASFRIEEYFVGIKEDLEALEAELDLETSTTNAEGLNVIGAQIWFVALALSRQLAQFQLDPENSKKFRQMYQTLVDCSLALVKINSVLNSTLKVFQVEGVHNIGVMKKIYKGSSETNLATQEIGEETLLTRDQSSITELAIRAVITQKHYENKENAKLKRDTPSSEYMTLGPDTLKLRRGLDIFVRNITKTGWVSFQGHFLPKNRIGILCEVLTQALGSIEGTHMSLAKLATKFKRGCGGFWCHSTCIPWTRKMTNYVDILVTNENKYAQLDNEVVRLQIFAIEILVTNLIKRGNAIHKEIRNIADTVLLGCEYLEKLYFFRIPKYDSLSELRAFCYEGTTKTGENFDDGSFFLNDYIFVLKQVPIRYGMSEYILLNKINASRQHSGANFDGPRFLKFS